MLKLVCINIEGNKHLQRLHPFLQKENADVVCLQEVLESDINTLKSDLYTYHFFVPMVTMKSGEHKGLIILSKSQPSNTFHKYYAGKISIPNALGIPNNNRRAIAGVVMQTPKGTMTIATTHFTWSSKGKTTQKQQKDLDSLFFVLDSMKSFVLCGDFNAPRGKAIYKRITQKYSDHIPKEITSTVDPVLHKAGPLPYVVDYIFSTKDFTAKQVKVVEGISDHKALVAFIEKTPKVLI